jgi:hypothetical protein
MLKKVELQDVSLITTTDVLAEGGLEMEEGKGRRVLRVEGCGGSEGGATSQAQGGKASGVGGSIGCSGGEGKGTVECMGSEGMGSEGMGSEGMGSEGKGRGECNVYKRIKLMMDNITTARASEEGGRRCRRCRRCRRGAEVTDPMLFRW